MLYFTRRLTVKFCILLFTITIFSQGLNAQVREFRDAGGNDILDTLFVKTFSCNAEWNQKCEGTHSTPLEAGYTYCIHELNILEINNSWVKISTKKNSVDIIYNVSSGTFVDRFRGGFKVELVIGAIKDGRKNAICLPTRVWRSHGTGVNSVPGRHSSRCHGRQPLDILKDPTCRAAEAMKAGWFIRQLNGRQIKVTDELRKRWKEDGLIP